MKGTLSPETTIVKEGFLEVRTGLEEPFEWIALWTVLSGLAPIEGLRDWEECLLSFYATSRVRTVALRVGRAFF
jgi:hypothetical protein